MVYPQARPQGITCGTEVQTLTRMQCISAARFKLNRLSEFSAFQVKSFIAIFGDPNVFYN